MGKTTVFKAKIRGADETARLFERKEEKLKKKATVGIEPTNNGFANRPLRPLGYVAETKK